MRQWVLSVPFPLRLLFASNPKVMTKALTIVFIFTVRDIYGSWGVIIDKILPLGTIMLI